jgi:hypothetical protein
MRAAAIGVQALSRLGIAGTTNALIAGAQVAKLSAEGSTQLLRLGVAGSTSLATIGTTAISAGGSATVALARAGAGISGALAKASAVSVGGLARIAVGATATGAATIVAFATASAGAVASAGVTAAAWLAAMAQIVATAAISGVAMAASFLAPFALIGVAIAGAIALVVAFKDQIFAALAPVGQLVGDAASAIGEGFSTAISDAIVVFTDLAATAKTTFGGIYEAIAGGDLQGAMDIAMAGLYAAWARGSEAIMGSVDSWAAFIQNTVTYMWAGIKGVFGDSINWVLNAFDDMVSAVQQSWNYVQSFIKKGFDLAAENKKVTDATTARKQERAATRGSGVEMRAADGIAAGRLDENVRRADERRANTVAAEDRLGGLVSGQRDQRIFRAQADASTESLGTAGTMDEVRALAEEFHLLAATGKVTQEQLKAFSDAAETAQDRIEGERGVAGAAAAAPVDPEAVKMAATAAAASQSEVAGSFSAASISGMGFGQSLAQKQLDTLKEIAANTALGGEGLVAA